MPIARTDRPPRGVVRLDGSRHGPAQARGGMPATVRTASSAASIAPGSLPPATASSAFLPVPPLTSLGASAMSSDAWSPLSAVHGGDDGRAAARRARRRARRPGSPGWSRTARASSRRSSRSRPSTRATTTPSTAPRDQLVGPAAGRLAAQVLQLVAELLDLGHPALDRVDDLVVGHAEGSGDLTQSGLVATQPLDRAEPGDGLDAAQVRPDRALADDLDRADVAGGAHVGAAAQLGRVRTGLEHPHDVAVLVAEEGDGAELLGELLRGLVVAHRIVGEDLGVGEVLDADELVGRDGLVVAEVEPQAVGVDQRALLLDVLAEHLAQGPVQQVGGGVVAADGVAPIDVDGHDRVLPLGDLAVGDARPRGGARRARRRRCRARVAVPVSVRIVPVSPTWPPLSA